MADSVMREDTRDVQRPAVAADREPAGEGLAGLGRKRERARLRQACRPRTRTPARCSGRRRRRTASCRRDATPARTRRCRACSVFLTVQVAMSITASDGFIKPLVATIAYRLSGVTTTLSGKRFYRDVLAGWRDAPAVRQQHAAIVELPGNGGDLLRTRLCDGEDRGTAPQREPGDQTRQKYAESSWGKRRHAP